MEKVKRSPKQRFKIVLRILLIIILIIAIICASLVIVSLVGIKSNKDFISSISTVEYDNQLVPELDDNGYYTFVTDDEFKIMQLTDVHIGAGFMCTKKDNMALNAVASMVSAEKPDLVIVTGDIAYPVPFQAGTMNNKNSAKLFAELMEQLGVYWCFAFGNHDTESYSYFSREQITKFYTGGDYPHCIAQPGPEDVDGTGNYVVNIKNTKGEITQSLFMLDSHSYVDNDLVGLMMKYDTIHENQVEWYEDTVKSLTEQNNGVTPKSLAFYHIPNPEFKAAWMEYVDNDFNDTENVKYKYGMLGEKDLLICSSSYNYGFFDKCVELGSTQGVFVGHDHLNNFSVNYKGIQLTYGYSIDYLAYFGIMNYGSQRGCTTIDVMPDGSFDCKKENYYQDKYSSVNAKENVSMDNYYEEVEDMPNEK